MQNTTKALKKLWVGINQIINNVKNRENGPTCIEIDDNGTTITITESNKIAEKFNKHYSSVADKILSKRKYQCKHLFSKYLKNPNSKSFMMTPTSNTEIIDTISNMDTSKSVGPNSIPNQLIQAIKHSISTPLAKIFNRSFISGIFPEFLKLTKIIPIHKKDSKLIISNYRPISLLSNINILKKMFKRLYTFLETNQCIYDLQCSFEYDTAN